MLVETAYRGPTDHKGSRINVRCLTPSGWRRTSVPYDHALDPEDNHRAGPEAVKYHRAPRSRTWRKVAR